MGAYGEVHADFGYRKYTYAANNYYTKMNMRHNQQISVVQNL